MRVKKSPKKICELKKGKKKLIKKRNCMHQVDTQCQRT
jgi:hypothetical protein